MCSDETNEFPTNESVETTINTSGTERTTVPASWDRRKFLKAAALGAAAAALLGKDGSGRLRFGAASALAHDISSFQCTANDVRIQGPGRILNEPCNCNGTFNAQVEFTVVNNAASARNCITLHMCPVQLPNGQIFNPGDIKLQGTVQGKSTTQMIAIIENYPCGAGLLCFGSQPAAGQGEVFAKGEDCPSGQCCSTITWRVPGQDPACDVDVKLIGSKCRHQQICIQGRGTTTLDCDVNTSGVQKNCAAPCGETATLRLCTTNAASLAPFTFELFAGSVASGTLIATRKSSNACENFVVGPLNADTTYTGRVTDNSGCARTDTATLTITTIPAPTIVLKAGPDCTGNATVEITNCDNSLTYAWYDNNTLIPNASGCSIIRQFGVGTHSITVVATKSGACTSPASNAVPFTVNPAVNAVLGAPQSGCDGVVTLTVTASGGSGTYSSFTLNGAAGTITGSGNSRTVTMQPQLNNQCRTITVTVTDNAGCSGTSNAQSFKQCVATTACP